MIELVCKVTEIEKILIDNLSKQYKVITIIKKLSGLELSQLSTRAKKNIEYNLVLINEILRKYPIANFDDYEKINGTDLDEILNHLKNIYTSLYKLIRLKYFYRKSACTDK
jgi:hypothetical protein